MHRRRRSGQSSRRAAASGALVVLVLVGGASPGGAGRASRRLRGPDRNARVHVLGDSLTAGGQLVRGPGIDDEASWVPAALGDPFVFRGGWATPGATTDDMRAAVAEQDAACSC